MRQMFSEKEIVKLVEELLKNRVMKVENMAQLTDEQCGALKCGDVIVKRDASGDHAYHVSFQKDNVGLCITYVDASRVETVSYDYTEGHWVYNSTDITPLGE